MSVTVKQFRRFNSTTNPWTLPFLSSDHPFFGEDSCHHLLFVLQSLMTVALLMWKNNFWPYEIFSFIIKGAVARY
jgi:hypothetical protein